MCVRVCARACVRVRVHLGCASAGLSVCVYVCLCVFSDLSRNNFTKISVEAAPLLATLYRPNLLMYDLGHSTWIRWSNRACVLRLGPRTCLSVDLHRFALGLDGERHS